MSTPPQGSPQGTYQIPGGALVMPPQPDVMTYALRQDQFESLCEGEMSTSRSLRDACVGAFFTGAVGLLTIDWDAAVKKGRLQLGLTILLCTMTGVAFVVGLGEQIRMWRTGTQSTYSRLVRKIEQYFGIP